MNRRSASAERRTIPIFPLHTVLFPGGRLPMRIFEPRYLDMVSACLRDGSGFGICLIDEGEEVGQAASVYEVGTYCTVSYFHQRTDGLLGITVTGEQRFRVLEQRVEPNQLVVAEVAMLTELGPVAISSQWQGLVKRLRRVLDELDHPFITMPRHYDDAAWVGARLIELMPLPLPIKQRLLSLDDPLERIAQLQDLLEAGDRH